MVPSRRDPRRTRRLAQVVGAGAIIVGTVTHQPASDLRRPLAWGLWFAGWGVTVLLSRVRRVRI